MRRFDRAVEANSVALTMLEDARLPRRQFLARAGATAAAAFLGACGSSSSSTTAGATNNAAEATVAKGGTLDIYTWPAYFSTENVKAFEHITGTTINQSAYQSDDAMFAKLAAADGNAGYDMAIPTGGWIPVMAQKRMLQQIDHSRVPFQNIDPELLNKPFDPGNRYSVPKDYGYNGVIYDPATVTKPIKTWTDFIDATKGSASGKVAFGINYGIISIGLWALGYSMNDIEKAHLDAAADLMKSVAPHVKAFDEFDIAGMVNGTIALMYCDQSVARQVLLQKPHHKFVVPAPHGELWIDNYTILSDAAHADQAYSFIDFQLRPANQVTDTRFIGYPTVVKGLSNLLPANTRFKDVIFIPPAVYDTLETYVVNGKIQGYIEDLANQVQAAA